MTSDAPDRSMLDKALDLGVFAPLGFALEFERLVPELAQAGRKQLAFSRSLGQAALKVMANAAASRSADPVPSPGEPASTAAATKPPAAKRSATNRSAAKRSGASKASVDGYDGLTAREIIVLARTAAPAQLAWMLGQERQGKARKTVLAALAKASA